MFLDAIFSLFRTKFRKIFYPDIPEERYKLLLELERKIDINFRNKRLLNQALTHLSYAYDYYQTDIASNERMEFLGDAVLSVIVCEYFYFSFPDQREGQLTGRKSLLVSKPILAGIGNEIGIGKYLLLAEGEILTGGRERKSTIADAYEALVGAIYIDRGLESARKFVKNTLLSKANVILSDERHLNFKSIFQEYAQHALGARPRYKVVSEDGPEHDKIFTIEVWVGNNKCGIGRGRSKKIAEQESARNALSVIEQSDIWKNGKFTQS